MAHRINTSNFENGEQMVTVNWHKTFDRHWQFSSKAEMLEAYGNIADANNVLADSFLWCDGQRYNFKKGMENCPLRENCKRWHKHQDKWYELNRIEFETINDFRKCKHFVSWE